MKRESAEDRWYFFLFSFLKDAAAGGGGGGAAVAPVWGFGGGATRDAGSSTCAGFRKLKGRVNDAEALTIFDSKKLVHKALVCELGEERSDHINTSVNDNERVKVAEGLWKSIRSAGLW